MAVYGNLYRAAYQHRAADGNARAGADAAVYRDHHQRRRYTGYRHDSLVDGSRPWRRHHQRQRPVYGTGYHPGSYHPDDYRDGNRVRLFGQHHRQSATLMANYSLGTKAFKLEGVPEMRKTLLAMQKSMTDEADEKYREQVKDVMMIPAKMIRDEAKDLVPVVTGRLQAAIFAAPFIKGSGALVGVHVKDAYYAPFVEY